MISVEAMDTFLVLLVVSAAVNMVFLLAVIPTCCYLCGRKPRRIIRYKAYKPKRLREEEEEESGVCDHA